MMRAPIVGYVDRLGYLRCLDCAGDPPPAYDAHGPAPILADGAESGAPCDGCGRIVGRSADHLGYSWTVESGLVEVVRVGASIIRAPLTHPFQVDGNRHGREWWPADDRYRPLWAPLVWETAELARADMAAAR